MNVRTQAQDVAGWYLSRLDSYSPHSENVIQFLKAPLLAVTLNALFHSPLDPAGGEVTSDRAQDIVNPSSPPEDEAINREQTKGKGAGDWRRYLSDAQVGDEQLHQSTSWTQKEQEAYDHLTRRTKARMEAFLAGCMLAVPSDFPPPESPTSSTSPLFFPPKSPFKKALNDMVDPTANEKQTVKPDTISNNSATGKTLSVEVGLSGFQSSDSKSTDSKPVGQSMPSPLLSSVTQQGKTLIRQISKPSSGASVKHPQISEEHLVVRLELYIRSLIRVRTLQEECVVAMETPRAIKARARFITSAFVGTAGCVRSMSPVLIRLLSCLTKELLAVETLSEEVVKVVRRVASEYEHETSFASLAFLSSPEKSADSHLVPLLVKYLRYLQSDFEGLIQECELERMLSRALDPSLRKFFKTVEFRSIGHLLEACQGYRSKLQNIELAPTVCVGADDVNSLSHSPHALNQALRDLRREVITVNGHVLPPVTSRRDLIYLLSQTLNSRTLTAIPGAFHKKKLPEEKSNQTYRRVESCPTMPNGGDQSKSTRLRLEQGLDASENSDGDIVVTSEYDSEKNEDGKTPAKAGPSRQIARKRRRSFHLSTIDLLTRRLLIAASRTGMGGDAYFIV